MQSNIYYKERKLQRNTEAQGLLALIKKVTFKPSVFMLNVITPENVKKILGLKTAGVGFNPNTPIPFRSFAWRSQETFYDHPDFGKIYIPKNIHITDGIKDYFIVLIDDEIELRYWPGFRISSKDIGAKINHVPVTSATEIKALEDSFRYLVDYLGINKTFEEKYAHVKGIHIQKDVFEEFLQVLSDNHHLIDTLSEKLSQAATDPLAFFIKNQKKLETLNIDEPSTDLYLNVLLHELQENKLLFSLDWKADLKNIEYGVSEQTAQKHPHILKGVYDQKSTVELLKMAASKLEKEGLSLAIIDADQDAYHILLIPLAKIDSLKTAAKKCRLKIQEVSALK